MLDKRQEEYLEQLASTMRSRNFPAEIVRQRLIHVERLLEEVGGDPVKICGQPSEYADTVQTYLEVQNQYPEAFEEPEAFEGTEPFQQKAYDRLEALGESISGQREETFEERRARLQSRRPKTLFGKVLRGILSLLQLLLALVLWILFLGVGLLYGVFCGIWVTWSGLRALAGIGTGEGEPWHLPVGIVMIVVGALLLFLMKPVIKRLTGRTISDGGGSYGGV